MKPLILVCCLLGVITMSTACSPTSTSTGSSSATINVESHSSCNAATGQPTTCTITLTNDSSSTASFDWAATSDPAGASFSPSAGSLAPGASAASIQVSIPAGICPDKLIFRDASHSSEVDATINTACQ